MSLEVTREDIIDAAQRVAPHVRRTPILRLGDLLGAGFELSLKLESTQVTGSFKPRGAFSLLTARDVPDVGVVGASGGNFGRALAYAAAVLGHRATIFVPDTSPEEKVGPIAGYGAEVIRVAGYYPEALEASLHFAEDTGALVAHAFDQHEIVAGQGTCGLELSEQAHQMETVIVAVGGGGLIGGVASWFRDDARVVAVEPELCPTLHAAREAGRPIDAPVGGIAASSLGGGRLGEYPWQANQFIDEALLVSDQEIVAAQSWLWDQTRVVCEPGPACTIAALLTRAYLPEPGEQVVCVISGANTDPASLA